MLAIELINSCSFFETGFVFCFNSFDIFLYLIVNNLKSVKSTGYNTCYTKEAVRYSAETFVVKQTFILRINFSANNRLLRIAPIRYAQL